LTLDLKDFGEDMENLNLDNVDNELILCLNVKIEQEQKLNDSKSNNNPIFEEAMAWHAEKELVGMLETLMEHMNVLPGHVIKTFAHCKNLV